MSLFIITYLLTAHYFSDFIFQSRKMGENKSTSLKWLTIHVLVYCLSFFVLMGIPYFDDSETIKMLLGWIGINGVLHWITDFVTSKMTRYLYKEKEMYGFWSVIGLDQLIHMLTLLWTFKLYFDV